MVQLSDSMDSDERGVGVNDDGVENNPWEWEYEPPSLRLAFG